MYNNGLLITDSVYNNTEHITGTKVNLFYQNYMTYKCEHIVAMRILQSQHFIFSCYTKDKYIINFP